MMKHENFGETTDAAQYAVTGSFPIDVWKSHNPKIMALTNDDAKTYIPLPYFKYNGKEPQYAGGRGAGWVATMITKNAVNPERIIRYLQYCWSDQGQMTNLFGREGVTFDYVNGRPEYKPEIIAEMENDSANFSTKYGFEQRLIMWRSKWAGLQKIALSPKAYTDYQQSVSGYGVDVWNMGLDSLDPDSTSSEGVAFAKIKNIWNKYLAQMVIAKDDAVFDAAYAAGMKEIGEAGLEKVKDFMTQKHLEDVAKKSGK
jgi:putative aldouronate transport system substrate-binding protein